MGVGHLVKVCCSKTSHRIENAQFTEAQGIWILQAEQHTEQELPDAEPQGDDYVLFDLGAKPDSPLKVWVKVDQQPMEIEVDTGASLSVLSETTYRQHSPDKEEVAVELHTYMGERLKGQRKA